MNFIHDDFLLQCKTASRLYHEYAEDQPILDYHNHLPPADIAENKNFANLTEIWLNDDHYKWRAMRANGVDERLITGDAPSKEKFLAWAQTVPQTLRNPLYHWTHLELKRYFGIDDLLDGSTAEEIWEQTLHQLSTNRFSTHGILDRCSVTALCTTDDPVDPLDLHLQIAASGLKTRVFPTFRPDKALTVDRPIAFNQWVDRLEIASQREISSLGEFLDALRNRHDAFHSVGGRLSDHGLTHCYVDFTTELEAAKIFLKSRSGVEANPQEQARFAAFMMLEFGRMDAEKGWTKQLHLGALRNIRDRGMREIGSETGHDAVGDWPQAEALAIYLDRLDKEGALPQMVLYNNNPGDNFTFSTLAGCFTESGVTGKIQFGSGWWFLDSKTGIEDQLNALSNNGLLSHFIGMLTDSRSFMSFPRHEYFRRVLCNLLGQEMEKGELPNDIELVGSMVRNISYRNAHRFLKLS